MGVASREHLGKKYERIPLLCLLLNVLAEYQITGIYNVKRLSGIPASYLKIGIAVKRVIHYKAGAYLPITENWIFNQIRLLKTYQPIIYCHGTDNLDIFGSYIIRSFDLEKNSSRPMVILNKACRRILGFYPFFARNCWKDKPDIVHAHFGPSGYEFLRMKKIFKVPMVTSFYGFDLSMLPSKNPEWKIHYGKLFQEGELFLVEGNHMKEILMQLGCDKEKIIVQRLGVDLEQIGFARRYLKDNEEVRILISGRFKEKKGIPYAIEAIGLLLRDDPGLKVRVSIIGDSRGAPDEEIEKENILSLIDQYELHNVVRLMGFQPPEIYRKELFKNHIFFSPSVEASDGDIEGGVPVSIIEASASGMPVVSTNHCDIPEVVLDGESGYLAPERDPHALVRKLKLLISDPNSWEIMGRRGRKHIESYYDVARQAIMLEEIYDRASAENQG